MTLMAGKSQYHPWASQGALSDDCDCVSILREGEQSSSRESSPLTGSRQFLPKDFILNRDLERSKSPPSAFKQDADLNNSHCSTKDLLGSLQACSHSSLECPNYQ